MKAVNRISKHLLVCSIIEIRGFKLLKVISGRVQKPQ